MNTWTIASDQTASVSEVESFAHDLRNPLAAIHLSAELLVRSSLSQPQIHRLAQNMYCASVRIRELLEHCLDRGRQTDRRFEVADLGDVVAGAVERIAVSAEFQSVRIELDVAAGLLVSMDKQRMRRVLVNLLVNALEVMPQGGTIHISTVSGRRWVLIRVRDTGPGISPEIRDRLFQPFATAGKTHGLGLGLASSRQVAIAHGGDIWAESPRSGASFVIRLPRTIAKRRAASC
ncbi:MAG: HAMP domain-containing sensor histidine kinase [Candidatus Solibacter sp.]